MLQLCASGRTFLPITKAPPAIAAQGGSKKPLMLQTHGSKFVQFQEVKIQELASEVWSHWLNQDLLLQLLDSV